MDQSPLHTLTSVKDVVKHPRAAELIAEAKGRSVKDVSGEDILKLFDKVVPGTKLGGSLGQALWSRAGVKAETAQTGRLAGAPYAYGVLALVCAAARANLEVVEIAEPSPGGCALRTKTPSSVWAFAGEAAFALETDEDGCTIEAHTVTKGQAFDWGRGKRLLGGVLDDAAARARTYATLEL